MKSVHPKPKSHLIVVCFLLVISALSFQCTKKARVNLPDCISAKIEQIKKEPRWNPPAEVSEYEFNGRRVFLFSSNCCDQYNVVYDDACNAVCAPSGGFTGKGDNKCPDFKENAKFVRVIWKDQR